MEQIIDLVSQERGRHFDPDLVDMFMANLERFREIAAKYQD
jgi:response regulator RpfG family c-di-GMP phosphodiesterase